MSVARGLASVALLAPLSGCYFVDCPPGTWYSWWNGGCVEHDEDDEDDGSTGEIGAYDPCEVLAAHLDRSLVEDWIGEPVQPAAPTGGWAWAQGFQVANSWEPQGNPIVGGVVTATDDHRWYHDAYPGSSYIGDHYLMVMAINAGPPTATAVVSSMGGVADEPKIYRLPMTFLGHNDIWLGYVSLAAIDQSTLLFGIVEWGPGVVSLGQAVEETEEQGSGYVYGARSGDQWAEWAEPIGDTDVGFRPLSEVCTFTPLHGGVDETGAAGLGPD